MKKATIGILISIMLLTQFTLADDVVHQRGDIIGNILSTDIQASINGYLIPSYNIDNKLAVYAKDLNNYGFNVEWLPELREVHIKRESGKKLQPITFDQNPYKGIGEKLGNVLYTDIKTYIDNEEIQSYNINGNTAIYFSDLTLVGQVIYIERDRKANLSIELELHHDEIIAELQQYDDNTDTFLPSEYFYTNNNQAIEAEGINIIQEYKETAKNIIEVANNLTPSIGKEFRNKYLFNRMPGMGRDYEAEVDQLIQDVKNNSIVKHAYFITDDSLVYISNDGERRIRGRYIFQYQQPTNDNYLKDKGLKNYRWYYQDIEVCIGFFFSKDLYKWEHSKYTYNKIVHLTEIQELEVTE